MKIYNSQEIVSATLFRIVVVDVLAQFCTITAIKSNKIFIPNKLFVHYVFRAEGDQQTTAPLLEQSQTTSVEPSSSSVTTGVGSENIGDGMTVASKELSPLKSSEAEFINARPIDESIISSVYNFVKKAAVVGCVYFVGYMGWSVAWLIGPVILSVIRDQWRKESDRKRNDAKVIAQSDEKRVVLARLNDLPSWVSFINYKFR